MLLAFSFFLKSNIFPLNKRYIDMQMTSVYNVLQKAPLDNTSLTLCSAPIFWSYGINPRCRRIVLGNNELLLAPRWTVNIHLTLFNISKSYQNEIRYSKLSVLSSVCRPQEGSRPWPPHHCFSQTLGGGEWAGASNHTRSVLVSLFSLKHLCTSEKPRPQPARAILFLFIF